MKRMLGEIAMFLWILVAVYWVYQIETTIKQHKEGNHAHYKR
jgi:hypothetical protein